MADKDEQPKTIAEDLVVTKYKMAGEIANRKLFDWTTAEDRRDNVIGLPTICQPSMCFPPLLSHFLFDDSYRFQRNF